MQGDLFSRAAQWQSLALPCAQIRHCPAWLAPERASIIFERLLAELQWSQPSIMIVGKTLPIPRMQAWYGDPGAVMRYSGMRLAPMPWHPTLLALREQLEQALHKPFNSVLANLYRTGSDSMGWHADNEKELGINPFIASVSLGGKRKFSFKAMFDDPKRVDITLDHGDLLTMGGTTQNYWHHGMSKTKKEVAPRINLTFRHIILEAAVGC